MKPQPDHVRERHPAAFISLSDGNGNVHAYAYDVLGRPVSDAIVTLGPGVDGAVRRLATAYDTGGHPYLFTTHDAATGGAIVDQVRRTYWGLGELIREYQQHGAAVDVATTPVLGYLFTSMGNGDNNDRPIAMFYPNSRYVDYLYNPGIDSAISRVSAMTDDSQSRPTTVIEAYTYLGLDTIVARAHPQTGVDLTFLAQTSDALAITDGGDRYAGLDRFGRVVDQNWVTGAGTPSWAAVDRLQYGYDRAGNRLYKANLTAPAQSELYRANSTASGDSNTAYDGLGRMGAFARGTLSASGRNGTQLDTIATASRGQGWALDALGNWSGVTTDGATVTRTANAQNQTTAVSGGTAPTYDANGNTTADGGKTFTYNAWNRLVAVKNGVGTTLESYRVDALGRRIIEDLTGSGGQVNHLYYTVRHQVAEERLGGTAVANIVHEYTWGLGYVDDLAIRDDLDAWGPTRRLYARQDANYNVTAITSATGVVLERYQYDPYGVVTFANANYTPIAGNVSGLGWQYLHQGGRLDTVSGWYIFRNRDLIAGEGRWAERDPEGLKAGDKNIYRYVSNSPSNRRDPSGLIITPPEAIAIVAIGPALPSDPQGQQGQPGKVDPNQDTPPPPPLPTTPRRNPRPGDANACPNFPVNEPGFPFVVGPSNPIYPGYPIVIRPSGIENPPTFTFVPKTPSPTPINITIIPGKKYKHPNGAQWIMYDPADGAWVVGGLKR